MIQPYALRAPEVILEAGFDTSADIWNLGCIVRNYLSVCLIFLSSQVHPQVFELLTGCWLFDPQEGPDFQLEDDHLAKMLEITGEQLDAETLNSAKLKSHYFAESGERLVRCTGRWLPSRDADRCEPGTLKRIPDLFPATFESALTHYSAERQKAAPRWSAQM